MLRCLCAWLIKHTGTPPHALSSTATIELQAVRLLIERCTRAASQPLTTRMPIAYHPAQPPTGASISPIRCSICAGARPPHPSAPPERRPQSCPERQVQTCVVPKAPCASSRPRFPTHRYHNCGVRIRGGSSGRACWILKRFAAAGLPGRLASHATLKPWVFSGSFGVTN